MAISPFDSAIWSGFWGDPEIAPLFEDAAEIRSMLTVEAALARVQGRLGIVPEVSATAISEAAAAARIDAAALADGTASSGVPVTALAAALRDRLAPDHAAWVHWGATTQDILDTALVLRVSDALEVIDGRLVRLIDELGQQAARHRYTVIAARTRGQIATPTTLGAKLAVWTMPLLRHRVRLAELRPRVLVVSLAGASGTNAALAGRGRAVMEGLAAELGLSPAEVPWHAARDGIVELGNWLALVTGSLGKIGLDLQQLGASEVAEVRVAAGGGSSTMPNKSNPVAAEALVTLARLNAQAAATLNQAMLTAQERDGAAWALEWFALPAMCAAAGAATRHGLTLAGGLAVRPDRLAATFAEDRGMMMAEGAVFALAETMPRPEALRLIAAAVAAVREGNGTLAEALAALEPGRDWPAILDPARQTGDAGAQVDRLLAAIALGRA